MAEDKDVLAINRLTDLADEGKKKEIQRELIKHILSTRLYFQDVYRPRRQRLLELNAIYRNKSYLDLERASWQTKAFIPLSYDAVERKTSILHQALWGNRLSSPFTAIGRTVEDHSYASSAEAYINNTMDRIGFYEVSEEGLRSCVKFGLGVYRYGWLRREEEQLWREVVRDTKGEVVRKDGKAITKFVKRIHKISQPFVRPVDIVDRFFYDPTSKRIAKWDCDFAGEIREELPEVIREREARGEYDAGSFDRLNLKNPHGLLDEFETDNKTPQMRRDEGLVNNIGLAGASTGPAVENRNVRHKITDWYGWFDLNGDGKRVFIKAVLSDDKNILKAETNLLGEYPFVDIQYSRSIHSLTPWGVLDPVVRIQYEVNEFHNQRGDSVKLKLNQQFIINVDKILEDHSYVSMPGAMHPVTTGDNPAGDALQPMQFPSNMEFLGVQEENMVTSVFQTSTGIADFNKVLSTANKNTPASTVISLLNEQQAGNSMIVNGILERHGVLGTRIFKMLQLFGDDDLVLRTTGRKGLQYRTESLENLLGEYDIKVTTSAFLGNKSIELQQLLQLKPLLADAQHIDHEEYDRAMLENMLPKRVDKIIISKDQPLKAVDELTLYVAEKGESVTLNDGETAISIRSKLRFHDNTSKGILNKLHEKKEVDGDTIEEFEEYLAQLADRLEELDIEQQLLAQQAARGQGNQPGVNGNVNNNNGLPAVRQLGNQVAPKTNNIQGG